MAALPAAQPELAAEAELTETATAAMQAIVAACLASSTAWAIPRVVLASVAPRPWDGELAADTMPTAIENAFSAGVPAIQRFHHDRPPG